MTVHFLTLYIMCRDEWEPSVQTFNVVALTLPKLAQALQTAADFGQITFWYSVHVKERKMHNMIVL